MSFGPIFQAPFSRPFGGAKTRYTLTLQPAAAAGIDTYVYSTSPTGNFRTLAYLRLLSGIGQGLKKFSGLSVVPTGATPISSILTLTLNTLSSGIQNINLYRILAANSAWIEDGATWNHSVGATHWAGDAAGDHGADAGCSVSGVDFSATLMGTFQVINNAPAGTAYSCTLNLAEVALMLASNQGIVIFTDVVNTIFFASSDHATPAYWPKLTTVFDA